MSSSVFIENNSLPKSTANGEGKLNSSSDSSLIVVYGKNGIHFDHKGLETFIEEKTLSSISVIRLISPTPSMQDDDEEVEKAEDIHSDEESDINRDKISSPVEDDNVKFNSIINNDSKGSNIRKENTPIENKWVDTNDVNTKKKYINNSKYQKTKLKRKPKRATEIVGLSLEEFYTAEDANALLKEALRKAGLSTVKRSAEYDFQLYVIKNDHCYTPFTSPDQIKIKPSIGISESDIKIKFDNTKTVLTHLNSNKSIIVKNKIQQQSAIKNKYQQQPMRIKNYTNNKTKIFDDKKLLDEITYDDKSMVTSAREEGFIVDDFVRSGISRNEKLDNHKSEQNSNIIQLVCSQKNKDSKMKPNPMLKTIRRNYSNNAEETKAMSSLKNNKPIIIDTLCAIPNNSSVSKTCLTDVSEDIIPYSNPKQDLEVIPALVPINRKPIYAIEPLSTVSNSSALIPTVRRGPIVQVDESSKYLKIPTSKSVKEIVITKVMTNPKGGFTDIGTLINETEISKIIPISNTCLPNKSISRLKGFMPLGIETAVKNQLPSQISIETHQSSSELAAENDKQLDLIDSIVTKELQKSGVMNEASSADKNFPELVEMLESSAKDLELNKNQHLINFDETTKNNEDKIDIPNSPLLDTHEGDIPDDFLQQVVKLIKDDKTLQDEVEKGVFEDKHDITLSNVSPIPKASVLQTVILQPIERFSTDSYIQHSDSSLKITNDTGSADDSIILKPLTPDKNVRSLIDSSTPKLTQSVRNEPIQIIRGNGRIITLPPIEAPTTRAKRRAQTKPISTFNDSSDISSHTNISNTIAISSEANCSGNALEEDITKKLFSKGSSVHVNKTLKKGKGKKSQSSNTMQSSNKSEHIDASNTHGDDDDPNKLWCICRQPHNNRFMICCDACEEWFHGTCVNITKAMGLEMEQNSVYWTCPKCVKKKEDKQQPKITDMLITKKLSVNPNTENSVELPTSDHADAIFGIHLECKKTESLPKKQIVEINKEQLSQHHSFENFDDMKTSPVSVISTHKRRVQTLKPSDNSQHITRSKTELSGDILEGKDENTSTADCIMCKKSARINSIYCSDECIRKHAQNALYTFYNKSPDGNSINQQTKILQEDKKKKIKGLFEDVLSMADRKPKVERVNVYERKSGRVLTGHNAPTAVNLRKWIQDNPTFQVVQPGSALFLDIEKKQNQRAHGSVNCNVFSIITHTSVSPHDKHEKLTAGTEVSKVIDEQHHIKNVYSLSTSDKPILVERSKVPHAISKFIIKGTQAASSKPEKNVISGVKEELKIKTKEMKRQADVFNSVDPEPIRLNVRRTLKEQLLLRIKEMPKNQSNSLQLTTDEVEDFVNQTEAEMYNYFNKDTGMKYKAKYRSLMFNIKDRKNHTLFAKICAKKIEAKQLVHMTAEELASQELAQWRENEAKHQLEMIKKSELDMLLCAKNYVLKTHKGEEVIEDKQIDRDNLDLTIPVEDVVSVLNNSSSSVGVGNLASDSSTTIEMKNENVLSQDLTTPKSTHHIVNNVSMKKTEKEKKKKHRKERDRHQKHNRDKRHKIKSRYKDSSYTRYSKSHSQNRDSRHKYSHKSDRYDRLSQNENVKDREVEQPKEHEINIDLENKSNSFKYSPSIKTNDHIDVKKKKKTLGTSKPTKTFSLIDQILKSTKTIEEAANLGVEKEWQKSGTTSNSFPKNAATNINSPQENFDKELRNIEHKTDSQVESPNSVAIMKQTNPYMHYYNVDSKVPLNVNTTGSNNIWNGIINMIDVASFLIKLQSVVGNTMNLEKLLPNELDVVGRIGPETVWDYISKIKKSPNKEIVIIRLVPANEAEVSAYTVLYQYLDKRKRLGVIKTTSSQIKDFYIYPLGADKSMPVILQPSEKVEFFEDNQRPDMLVGIIIRVIGKRSSHISISNAVPSVSTSANLLQISNPTHDECTPPGSPKRRKTLHNLTFKNDAIDIDAIIKAPIATKNNKCLGLNVSKSITEDADEPYSPGGSSDDDVPFITGKSANVLDPHNRPETELKRKMDELNRQIAAQEMEIAGLLNVESSRLVSSSSKSTVLANISIPSNLSQILASIKSNPEINTTHSDTEIPLSLNIGSITKVNETNNDEYNPEEEITSICIEPNVKSNDSVSSSSRLAQLSEAELLRMVPDFAINEDPKKASSAETSIKSENQLWSGV